MRWERDSFLQVELQIYYEQDTEEGFHTFWQSRGQKSWGRGQYMAIMYTNTLMGACREALSIIQSVSPDGMPSKSLSDFRSLL